MINDILDGGGIPTPLKNYGHRQLGWWHSQYDGNIKTVPTHQTATMGIMNNKVMYIQVWIHSIWNRAGDLKKLNSDENSNIFLKPPYP